MDRFKNVAKGGWHPEKGASSTGGGTSDSKLGQVRGWVGKAQGKDAHAASAREHQSAPLSSLKDPASFAPPPKRVDYNGGGPVASTGSSTGSTSAKQRLQETEEARRRAEEEANRPPPGPYRPDTTGLSTAHLPKPPAFRPNAASPPATSAPSKPKPSLPPRLPPRQNSNPDEFAPPPPPTYTEATQQATLSQGALNQGALNRLGQAGVSVPGFGIGRTASPPVPARRTASPPVPPRQNSLTGAPLPPSTSNSHASQLGELQSRFETMPTPSSGATAPSTGTSWADKQAALRTASSLQDDPTKVTTSDLKSAASTANNFQQRHGDQVASGWRAASGLNQKYGIAGKVNSFASTNTSPAPPESPMQSSQGVLGKKAPPPPPPKKKELGGSSGEPPPIPLGSKPKF